MKKTILGVSILAALASTQVMAQDGTWYVSGAFGQSDFNEDFGPGFTTDKKDTSFGVAVGYNFTRNIAVEGGFINFGKFKTSGTFLGVPETLEGKAQSLHASAILSWPVADAFSVYGRLGLANTDRKATDCLTFGTTTICGSGSEKKTELLYGVGAGYAFTKNLTGTVEYQKLNDTDVSSLNLGVRFSF